MILLTVGTLAPFDRLVVAVDELIAAGVLREDVFGQIGETTYKPRHFKAVAALPMHEFVSRVRASSMMIAHAGMGSIITALEYERPLLVMPRLRQHGEHVNDHQVGTAQKFAASGHVLAAMSVGDLRARIEELPTFVPGKRSSDASAVRARVAEFLSAMSRQARAR